MFQHRHYVELARMVGNARGRMSKKDFEVYVEEWTDMLRGTNPRFDAQRFRTACRGEPINWRDNGAKAA